MKLDARPDELNVRARSDGRQVKEIAIRRKAAGSVAVETAGRAFGFVTITLPGASEKVGRALFHFRVDQVKLRQAE